MELIPHCFQVWERRRLVSLACRADGVQVVERLEVCSSTEPHRDRIALAASELGALVLRHLCYEVFSTKTEIEPERCRWRHFGVGRPKARDAQRIRNALAPFWRLDEQRTNTAATTFGAENLHEAGHDPVVEPRASQRAVREIGHCAEDGDGSGEKLRASRDHPVDAEHEAVGSHTRRSLE